MAKEESGIRRTVWLPKELDEKVEQARKLLGLSKSDFYRHAIVETIKSLLTTKTLEAQEAQEGERNG